MEFWCVADLSETAKAAWSIKLVRLLLLSNDPTTLALVRAASDAFESTLDAFGDATDLKRKLNKQTDADSLIVMLDLASVALAGLRIANLCAHVKQADL